MKRCKKAQKSAEPIQSQPSWTAADEVLRSCVNDMRTQVTNECMDINTPLFEEVEHEFQWTSETRHDKESGRYMNIVDEPEFITGTVRRSLEERLNGIGNEVLEF